MARHIASVLVGNAGEHYVMAELLRRGHNAALTSHGSPDIDILASEGTEAVRIRVKTKTDRAKEWRWNVKVPKWTTETREECITEAVKLTPFRNVGETGDYCVLVAIGDVIEYYIVPTADVERILQRGFECWIKTTGVRGPRSVANPDRRISPDDVAEKGNWGALWG